jgi:hypothetical protein
MQQPTRHERKAELAATGRDELYDVLSKVRREWGSRIPEPESGVTIEEAQAEILAAEYPPDGPGSQR